MKNIPRIAIFLLIIFSTPLAWGAEKTGRQHFDAYLNDFVTMKARFEQVLKDEQGVPIDQSEGVVYLQRPGKFRWDYKTPYEQVIVTNGDRIWIYDVELEQVTVKRLDTALGDTPAALLGSDVNIEDQFVITELGNKEGLAWVGLEPKKTDGQYRMIRLGFSRDSLRIMSMSDNFGQTTDINFSDEQRNATIDSSLFNFVPPQGVDVIDSTDEL